MSPENDTWFFGSFFTGGFECSQHLTPEGVRLDLIKATGHDEQLESDYRLCKRLGLNAVREAVRWPLIDKGGKIDRTEVRRLARAGREAGVTQLWDLMHYGYPEDLDPFSERFVERFGRYAGKVAEVIRDEAGGPLYFTPVNEISYYAWAGGEVGYMAPFGQGRGGDLKRQLVRAAIAGANAVWEVDPAATMLSVDPLVRQVAPASRPDLAEGADYFNEHVVFEAFDLLSGRLEPELGGSRRHLGIVGLNYYRCNQWTIPTPEEPQIFLSPKDKRWLPLHKQLEALQERYGGPLFLAETGASAHERKSWLELLVKESKAALKAGVDLQGVCLYPVITSPDWEDPTAFFDGGVFDIEPDGSGCLKRVLKSEIEVALRSAQQEFDPQTLPNRPFSSTGDKTAERTVPQKVTPERDVPTKPDNFTYRALLAGESLCLETYTFAPGQGLSVHQHKETEHVWTVLAGRGCAEVGTSRVALAEGDALLVPAGTYHGLRNEGLEPFIVQQVSSPKPWNARYGGPQPADTFITSRKEAHHV